jgi:hypothetical protein
LKSFWDDTHSTFSNQHIGNRASENFNFFV